MNDVYDIIQLLCDWYGYTMRDFSKLSTLPYTTFVSMMKRRPEKISVNSLKRIAAVFEHEWYEMLGYDKESIPTLINGRNINGARIETALTEDTCIKVVENISGKEYAELIGKNMVFHPPIHLMKQEMVKNRDNALHSQFKMCIDLVSDRLNDDGVIEAMRYILELTQNPKYNASTDQITKEDTGWQKEEQ